jgi:selenocysteine-specific elongation factor
MIIGTAGHIDHGKTTLVRALTGTDTDRLPEEKRRGISIELGYAFLKTPQGETIGFIDVPGHERLVHTMLAGATGIDLALLLVAADDGVMPQTREHLAVLALLGISRGVVAITKIDRAEHERVQAVKHEVQALLAQTSLADARVVEVSAVTGSGIDELRALLIGLAVHDGDAGDAAGAGSRSAGTEAFRLAVDRAFTLAGTGTVVTGTVHAGEVRVGTTLSLMPVNKTVRVRSLHAQNAPSERGIRGQRCALALAGIAREEIERGMWLCDQAIANASTRIDVELRGWHEEPRPLRNGMPVHVHAGASDAMASIVWLDRDSLAPGEAGLAQLVLQVPICAWHGDRVVLRDASASRAIAGGRILDPFAPARYRRTETRLGQLEAWRTQDAANLLNAVLKCSPWGLPLDTWQRATGILLAPETIAAHVPGGCQTLFNVQAWQALQDHVLRTLAAFHAAQPDELGPDNARLRRLAAPRCEPTTWQALLAQLVTTGKLVQAGAWWHLPDHVVRLSAQEEKLAQKLLPLLQDGAFDPPWVRDLAKQTHEPELQVRVTLSRMARRAQVFQVVKDLYYHADAMARLAHLAREIEARDGEVRAASFRDATGLGRKRAIQVLEFLDRVGLLRRLKEAHVVRHDARVFAALDRAAIQVT